VYRRLIGALAGLRRPLELWPEAFAESVTGGSASLPVKAAPKTPLRSLTMPNGFYAGLHLEQPVDKPAGRCRTGRGGSALAGQSAFSTHSIPPRAPAAISPASRGCLQLSTWLGDACRHGSRRVLSQPHRGSQAMVVAVDRARGILPTRCKCSATLRARTGVVVDHWLYYATGGLAWTMTPFAHQDRRYAASRHGRARAQSSSL